MVAISVLHISHILITGMISVLHICVPVSAVLCVHMSLFQELLFPTSVSVNSSLITFSLIICPIHHVF